MSAPTDFLAGVLGSRASTAGRIFEPQRSNAATLRINLNGSFGSDDSLLLSIASFQLPKNSSEETSIAFLNETRKFAGSTSFSDISVSYHDYIDRATLRTLLAWRMYIHDPRTGKKGLKSTYAKNGTIDLFGPDGAEGQDLTYLLEGIWPRDFDPGDIDYSSNEPVRVSVTFAVDRAYIDPDSVFGASVFSAVDAAQSRTNQGGITAP